MSTTIESPSRTGPRPRGASLFVSAAVVAVLLLGFVRRDVEASALAAPQEKGAVQGGLNPAEQRAEMIRLLRSIDQRLEALVAASAKKTER